MTIWILAVFLFIVVGALGRQIGGIRMGVSLLGVLVALFVAGPLAPYVRLALGAVGVKNPITVWALAAPLAFVGVMLVFNSIAVAVYLKTSGYYKFRAPDDVRIRWERIDAATGLSVGLLAAVVYLVAGCAYVYHAGYFTRQLESPTDNPVWLKLVNKLRDDLSGTKFDRVAAGVGQARPAFFQTADVLGLLYHNPELQERLTEYPQFLSLAEQGEFQTVFTNETFKVLLPAKTNVSLLLKDPTFQPLLAHPEFQRNANELDPADLLAFLQTGRSEKYAKEPLVGKWQLDLRETVKAFQRANPKVSATDVTRLASLMRYAIADYTLTATPDEKVYVKGRRDPIAFAALMTVGFRLSILDTNTPVKNVLTGSWKKEGESYQFTLQSAAGEKTAEAKMTGGSRLTTPVGANTVVFNRLD